MTSPELFFQPLEKRRIIFPMIGKTAQKVSNDWKLFQRAKK